MWTSEEQREPSPVEFDSLCLTDTPAIARTCNLPDHILSVIFHGAVEQSLIQRQGYYKSKPIPITALSISHTCRHFRAVAFSCQRMWRYIDFRMGRMSVKCAHFFAFRAKTIRFGSKFFRGWKLIWFCQIKHGTTFVGAKKYFMRFFFAKKGNFDAKIT